MDQKTRTRRRTGPRTPSLSRRRRAFASREAGSVALLAACLLWGCKESPSRPEEETPPEEPIFASVSVGGS
jgi:hypothetical protein